MQAFILCHDLKLIEHYFPSHELLKTYRNVKAE